jgi:hypothetical protein
MRRLAGCTQATSVATPSASASWARRIVAIPRPCHASATAKASSARLADIGMKLAWATISSSGPDTARRPVPSVDESAGSAVEVDAEAQERNQRASGDRPRRNAATPSASLRTTGRR